MKRILFFIVFSTLTLASCRNDSGVNLGSDDISPSSSSGIQIATNNIPQSAKNLIASRYAGYSIKEVQKELEHGATIYKVTLLSGKAKIRLLFDANWNFLGEKN